MGANPDGLLYSTASFLIGGVVCGLRRCRSVIQLIELFIVLSTLGIVWDFFRYYCHITLNDGVVVRANRIVVYLCGSSLYREGFVILIEFCFTFTDGQHIGPKHVVVYVLYY